MPELEPVEDDDVEAAEDVAAASNGDAPDEDTTPEVDVAAVNAGNDEDPDKA